MRVTAVGQFRPDKETVAFSLQPCSITMNTVNATRYYLLSLVITAAVSANSQAETLRYEIAASPPDAFRLDDGLSGHVLSARLTGGFSVTVEAGPSEAWLHNFDLRLADVTENFDLPLFNPQDFEGKPLQDFLPVDMESLPAEKLASATESVIFFGEVFAGIPIEPWAAMQIHSVGKDAQIILAANLNSVGTVDGGTVLFKPLFAILVPEPRPPALRCRVS